MALNNGSEDAEEDEAAIADASIDYARRENEDTQVVFSRWGKAMYPTDVDYAHRPDTLSLMSLYNFKRYLRKVPLRERHHFSFLGSHPQSGTHGLVVRTSPVIPNVNVSIPSKNHARQEKREEYSFIIFLLFCPWRRIAQDHLSFSLPDFVASCDRLTSSYIANIDLLSASKEEADRLSILRRQENLAESAAFNSADDYQLPEEYSQDFIETTENWELDFTDEQLNHSALEAALQNAPEYIAEPLRVLDRLLASSPSHGAPVTGTAEERRFDASSALTSLWKKQLTTLAKLSETADDSPLNTANESTEHRCLQPYSALVSDLSSDHHWTANPQSRIMQYISSQALTDVDTCPISAAVSTFNLNQKQMSVIRLVGLQLKGCLYPDPERSETVPPLRLFVSGQGGTGKTHVINAIRHLFINEGASHLLACAAPTGVAAYNIDAPTLSSLFNFGVNADFSKFSLAKVAALREKLRLIRFLLIDEISMVSQKMLFNIHLALQSIFANNLPFGGINLIVLGDFLQLAPVRAQPLYANFPRLPDATEPWSKANIWSAITVTIKLTRQMRAAGDPAFLSVLEDARRHQLSQTSLASLQGRIIANNPQINILATEWLNAPILVNRNSLRDRLNVYKHRAHCRSTAVTEYVINALDLLDGQSLNESIKRRFLFDETHNTPGSDKALIRTDNISPKSLHISKGARVIITKNLNTKLGLVNGAPGTIHSILLPPGANPFVSAQAPGCKFLSAPPVVLFKPDKPPPHLENYTFSGLEDYPPGLIPITATGRLIKFNCPTSGSSSALLNITRYQLDLDLAYALTDYKCQGMTYTNTILDLSPPPTGSTDSNSNYVKVSRLKSLAGLLILRPFPDNVFNAPIPLDLVSQLQRENLESLASQW